VTRVMVIDSERTQREQLIALLSSHEKMHVVATATTCNDAIAMIKSHSPDIAIIGHWPPILNALEVTQCIMELCPVPIIIITGSGSAGEVASTFDAMTAGALAVMPRPDSSPITENRSGRELLQTVRLMAEVRVVRRWPKKNLPPSYEGSSSYEGLSSAPATTSKNKPGLRIVAVGASTGGPLALATLFAGLPKDFIAPIVVVQHMAVGFMRGFVDWLAPSSALPVHIATKGEFLFPGHIYMAPDNAHMTVTRHNRIDLSPRPADNGIQPSVACLFRSVAEIYGNSAAAVLLTGMGRDGAAELLLLKQKGGITFAQDKASSIVHGMPGEAIRLGGATYIQTPTEIAAALTKMSASQHAGELV
jgi:two-component system chemotaxis response regulator CheB